MAVETVPSRVRATTASTSRVKGVSYTSRGPMPRRLSAEIVNIRTGPLSVGIRRNCNHEDVDILETFQGYSPG